MLYSYDFNFCYFQEKHTANKEKGGDSDAELSTSDEPRRRSTKKTQCQDLICKYCERSFKFPSLLRDHLATHEGARPWICTECGMDFLKVS